LDAVVRSTIASVTIPDIHELNENGRPIIGFCFVPAGALVAGDVMLAQKALETDELAIAVAEMLAELGASSQPFGLLSHQDNKGLTLLPIGLKFQ
jgi:hypothetical protein